MSVDFWANILAAIGVRPSTADDWADTFARVMEERPFSSDEDVPNFLGQVVHESAMLERIEENLSYSAQRLCQVWPRRFPTLASAQPFARNPRALANKVYGGRLGNTAPDDGWAYRGRGLIQITGKTNYRLCSLGLFGDMRLLTNPQLLQEWQWAVESAGWYWDSRNVNALADGDDFDRVTRAINGGLNGQAQRLALYHQALGLLRA